jgi:DNA-binding LytR/AlgR family response regulator
MKKIRCYIVDDEQLALDLLGEFLSRIADIELIGRERSAPKAMEFIQKNEIDLLFLDIQMPQLSGNSLLRNLRRKPLTIFTTAYDHYAVEAFELEAIDYLLKPFSFERFMQAIDKARERMHKPAAKEAAPTTKLDSSPEYAVWKVDGKLRKIYFQDILFIEAKGEYIQIHTEQKRWLCLDSLSRLETDLPQNLFARVHRSYIVATKRVSALDGHLIEIDEHRIPVSRRRKEEVINRIFPS